MKKTKKDVLPGDDYTIPTSCSACEKCRANSYGRCLYGGPFTGFSKVDNIS